MKKLLALAALCVAFAAHAQSAPRYLESDLLPAGVTHCGITIDAQPKVIVPVKAVTTAPAGNLCFMDLLTFISTAAVGPHRIIATAIVRDPSGVFPDGESAPSLPLDLTRPGIPAAPVMLRLVTAPRT